MTNSEFMELERRCKKLKYKKIAKIFAVIIAIFLLIFAVFLYFNLSNSSKKGIEKKDSVKKSLPRKHKVEKKKEIEKKKADTPTKKKKEKVDKKVVAKKISEPKNKQIVKQIKEVNKTVKKKSPELLKLYPAFDVEIEENVEKEDGKNDESPNNEENPDTLNDNFDEYEENGKNKYKSEEKSQIQEIKKDAIKKVDIKMSFKKANKETILLKNFTVESNYENALKLASYYLSRKEYKKSEIWAKKANNIDSLKEDSWLIYAKSKYYQGDKKGAMKSLKFFLRYANSQKAYELYQKIKEDGI